MIISLFLWSIVLLLFLFQRIKIGSISTINKKSPHPSHYHHHECQSFPPVDNTEKPLRYHRDDSVVVFRYYQQKYPTLRSRWFIILLLSIFSPQPAHSLKSSPVFTPSVGTYIHVQLACTRKLLPGTRTQWFCRRIPDFAELGIEPVSSVFSIFVDKTEKLLRYNLDASVVLFRYYQNTPNSNCWCWYINPLPLIPFSRHLIVKRRIWQVTWGRGKKLRIWYKNSNTYNWMFTIFKSWYHRKYLTKNRR